MSPLPHPVHIPTPRAPQQEIRHKKCKNIFAYFVYLYLYMYCFKLSTYNKLYQCVVVAVSSRVTISTLLVHVYIFSYSCITFKLKKIHFEMRIVKYLFERAPCFMLLKYLLAHFDVFFYFTNSCKHKYVRIFPIRIINPIFIYLSILLIYYIVYFDNNEGIMIQIHYLETWMWCNSCIT